VLLAELCGSGNSRTTDRSYLAVIENVAQYTAVVTDTESVMSEDQLLSS
jgi:hypothetical protein